MQPLLREQAAASEAKGELTAPVVKAIEDAGFYGMWIPAELGGSELTPRQSLDVLEELAIGDASTSWVVMAIALATGVAGAYLSKPIALQYFPPNKRPFAGFAGQGTRPGKAVPTDGGYLLSGSWSFASGIKHCKYIHTAGIVETTGEPRIFNLPTDTAKFTDNWNVMGLRATGSIDYTIDNLFVAEEHTFPVLTQDPVQGGSLYRLGIINFAGICHSGWALGVARRMLDDLRDLTKAKIGRVSQATGNDSFQSSFGEHEARLRAARAFVFQTWEDIEETLSRNEQPSTRQETLGRLSLYNATWTAHAVSEYVYTTAGTVALREGPIQRYFRDMHAGTQHITSSPGVLRNCGQELAGLAEGKRWQFLNLVD
jgi:alkylation response protein AidB-like acyl-CoA dehydrogenase